MCVSVGTNMNNVDDDILSFRTPRCQVYSSGGCTKSTITNSLSTCARVCFFCSALPSSHTSPWSRLSGSDALCRRRQTHHRITCFAHNKPDERRRRAKRGDDSISHARALLKRIIGLMRCGESGSRIVVHSFWPQCRRSAAVAVQKIHIIGV